MPPRARKAKKPPEPPAEEPKPKAEPGLPDPDAVVSEEAFTSPSGAHYRIFHTDETDAYEEPKAPSPRRRRSAKRSAPGGDAQ